MSKDNNGEMERWEDVILRHASRKPDAEDEWADIVRRSAVPDGGLTYLLVRFLSFAKVPVKFSGLVEVAAGHSEQRVGQALNVLIKHGEGPPPEPRRLPDQDQVGAPGCGWSRSTCGRPGRGGGGGMMKFRDDFERAAWSSGWDAARRANCLPSSAATEADAKIEAMRGRRTLEPGEIGVPPKIAETMGMAKPEPPSTRLARAALERVLNRVVEETFTNVGCDPSLPTLIVDALDLKVWLDSEIDRLPPDDSAEVEEVIRAAVAMLEHRANPRMEDALRALDAKRGK